MQYFVARRCSRRWRSGSGSSRSRSTRSSGRWRRTTTSGACRCRRRAACCSIATARSSSRTRTPSTSRSSASRRRTSIETLRILARATGADEAQLRETVNRRRRDPSYRPIVLIENATLEQVIAVTSRGMRAARHHLPGSADAPVSRRATMAAHLFGYVSEVTEAQLHAGRLQGRRVRARSSGRPGVEQAYNRRLMGTDGNKAVVVNSLGREIDVVKAAELRSQGRAAAAADDRRRRAAGGGGRVRRVRLQRRRGRPRSAQRRGARVRRASRPTIPTPLPPASIARPGTRSTPTSSSRCRTARCRGATRPDRRSRWRSALAGLEEGVITPDFRVSLRRRRERSTAGTSSAGSRGARHRRPAPRDRAVVRRVLLHGREHARRRPHPQVGDAARAGRSSPASICPTKCRASCRRPSGRRQRTKRRSGTPARRSRSSIGQGQVSVTPISLAVYDDDRRQRRHPVHAARAQGGRRRAGLERRAGRRRRKSQS